MKRIGYLILAGVLCGAPAYAADARREPGAAVSTRSEALSEGEVRKVDVEAKKITIKHGRLVNLDMPAMTMVYRVTDPAMLRRVKPGDKVKFRAESLGGVLTVTKIEPAR